ncbi:MAG: undecaprenyl-phosphate galactose phosphotransferase WbaP [Thermodesulfovibrionales bacterium]
MKKALNLLLLFIFDISAICISLEISLFIRRVVFPPFIGFPEFVGDGLLTYWWVFPIYLFFFVYEGLLTKRFTFWDEIKHIWKASFFSTITIFSILFLGKIGIKYSRTVVVLTGALSFFIIPAIRLSAKRLLISIGLFRNKVIILGAGKTGQLVAKALKDEKNLGYKVAGFLDDDPGKVGRLIEGIKVHKGIDKVERYIGRSGINSVIIAMPGAGKERLNHLINSLQHKAENILFIPDILGIAVLGTKIQHFFREQAFALEIQNNLAKPLNIFLKRCFDFTLGSLFLALLILPIILISLLIRIDSSGSPIFSQKRVGKKGKTFRCYKFRTMYEDAEERLLEIISNNEDIRKEWEKSWKLKDDPRVTRVGRFLRETSLDELPQLVNVIKGEMSLVGPRPVIQEEIDKYYRDSAELCFSVPPGITGLWQVSGRSNTSYDYRIALDSWYVRNWNLWLDIVIIFKTIKVILKREGAY